ncbi:MAG: hypothetical protein HUJ94_01200 [Bacteroidales bacterium]|nr:hypothetical protein [Bacteroidales bacterium]
MKIYHIYSCGDKVLFREDRDYAFFCNHFGILSLEYRMHPLMLTVLSTHFHAIVEPEETGDMDGFIADLVETYRARYRRNYVPERDIPILTCVREIADSKALEEEAGYIARNPAIHKVTGYPLEYKYSSAAFLFADEFTHCMLPDSARKSLIKVSELGPKKRRTISVKPIPGNWLADRSGFIQFDSYINMKKARAIWSDDADSFTAVVNGKTDMPVIDGDAGELSCPCISDTAVCERILHYSRSHVLRSFHHIGDYSGLKDILEELGATREQIRRCLWL